MKNTILLALGVTIGFAGVGYGAGKYLSDGSDKVHAAADEKVQGDEVKAEPVFVEVGAIRVPVYKPRYVNYVMTNLSVAVTDPKEAEFYETEEGKAKVRNEVLVTMLYLAETDFLDGPAINTEELSHIVMEAVGKDLGSVKGLYFSELYSQKVNRG